MREFIDVVTTSPAELAIVDAEAGIFSNPPPGLAAAISWESGDDQVTCLMVWDTPGQRGDFAAERMMPLLASGRVSGEPERLKPHQLFVRGS
jgi:hypothetical protein